MPERLEDGYLSISGRVVDEDGLPVAGARVAILGSLHEADALQVRGETIADEAGRFDVRAAMPGEIWLTAFTPGVRPATLRCATLRCATEAGFMDLAEPLHLERGVAIAGRVSADDAPLDRVELELVGPRSARRVRIGEYELVQISGQIEWGVARCMTDAAGGTGNSTSWRPANGPCVRARFGVGGPCSRLARCRPRGWKRRPVTSICAFRPRA